MSSGYSGYARDPTIPTPQEQYQIDFSNAQIQYPAANFLPLEGEIPAKRISDMLGAEISFFENKDGNRAQLDLFKTRSNYLKQQKNVIDTKIKAEQNIFDLQQKQIGTFGKELLDFSSINFANLSADQARIEGNTKKFLSLGILGAALLG
jgi:hypothetical protein